MSDLMARFFGVPFVTRSDRSVSISQGCLSLLAHLLLQRGQVVPRSRLLELFGADVTEATARRRLNTTVWRLRCALEPDGAPRETVLASTARGLGLAAGCRAWTDVGQFEDACGVSRSVDDWIPADAARLQGGIGLYTGPFLDGMYDDWVLVERARLADLHLSALLRLVRWHESLDEYELALRYGRLAASTDPLREDLQRLVMRLYRRIGLPEMARRQFEACRSLLLEELGVEPLPETQDAAFGPDALAAAVRGPLVLLTMRTTLTELERVRNELRLIGSRLDDSISALRSEVLAETDG